LTRNLLRDLQHVAAPRRWRWWRRESRRVRRVNVWRMRRMHPDVLVVGGIGPDGLDDSRPGIVRT
jgi:hypothetical protein